MGSGEVVVEAEVRPTESEDKVLRAIYNVFEPERVEKVQVGDHEIIRARATSLSSLLKLHRLLRVQEILEAARSYMLKEVRGDTVTILLHKQAAYEGKVSLLSWASESPLGPIKISIKHPNIRDVIDWLAPQTSHGRALWEKGMPDP
ncbi:MAG: RNA-binding domain-containing protein [Acidilobus sp.]